MFRPFCFALAALSLTAGTDAGYTLLHEYAGQNFFAGWDFYGSWDNLTLSNTTWVSENNATLMNLAYINDAGNAIMRVDNTTDVQMGETRNAVRITTQEYLDIGTLWIVDALHIPYGCSVWPAFWSKGPHWPFDGEIDIIEAINMMGNNQMALHTTEGCVHTAYSEQTGYNIGLDCSPGSGCVVAETKPNSYGSGFAAAGGGVWATQFDVAGIFIWFWSRADVPASIANATADSTPDPSTWGPPSASYPTTNQCNTTEFFTAQQIVFDIALCGDWAGVPSIYQSTGCYLPNYTDTCYSQSVVGPGSPTYDEAYWEVRYLRTYTLGTVDPPTTSSEATQPTGVGLAAPTGGSPSAAIEAYLPLRLSALVFLGVLIGSVLLW